MAKVKASFILPKLAIFVLLIGTLVPTFGEGQMVIEKVITAEPKLMNVVTTVGCQSIDQICAIGLDCCEGLYCKYPSGSQIGTPGECKAKGIRINVGP